MKVQRLVGEAARQLQSGRPEAAARLCASARAQAPREFVPLYVSGLVALQSGNPAKAAEWLEQARALKPKSASAIMSLGLAWSALGRRAEAETALRQAVELAPESAENRTNLGALLVTENRIEEALVCFRRAVELNPGYAAGWNSLGAALLLAGRGQEAIPAHDRAIALAPGHPKAFFNRAQALHSCHRTAEAIADFRTQLTRSPQHLEARSYLLFLLNYLDESEPQALCEEHRAYGRMVAALPRRRAVELPNSPVPNRKIRLAFLSPDLRQHSVAYFLEPLLQQLDSKQFEVHLYHDHPCVDAVSRRLQGHAAHWQNFAGLSADAVEDLMRKDAPDVLVDLAGHTGYNRLPLFARRLAPVQITYLGYPNTTGLDAVDYRFTDAVADPAGSDALYSEELVRFAPTAWTYAPPLDAPEVAPVPCAGDASAPVTFGSFNVLSKVSDATLRVWHAVLEAVPHSRLVLKSGGLEPAVWRARLAAFGFEPGRVQLLPKTRTVAEHLATYSQLDIALDPLPYHGTTTTCEALWMGRPVVTLRGNRHASRVGPSLLTAIGRPEWIAETREDYVRIAAQLAADRRQLAEASRELRPQMLASPILDHAGQAKRFGTAVRETWMRWCADAVAPKSRIDAADGQPARLGGPEAEALASERPSPISFQTAS